MGKTSKTNRQILREVIGTKGFGLIKETPRKIIIDSITINPIWLFCCHENILNHSMLLQDEIIVASDVVALVDF